MDRMFEFPESIPGQLAMETDLHDAALGARMEALGLPSRCSCGVDMTDWRRQGYTGPYTWLMVPAYKNSDVAGEQAATACGDMLGGCGAYYRGVIRPHYRDES